MSEELAWTEFQNFSLKIIENGKSSEMEDVAFQFEGKLLLESQYSDEAFSTLMKIMSCEKMMRCSAISSFFGLLSRDFGKLSNAQKNSLLDFINNYVVRVENKLAFHSAIDFLARRYPRAMFLQTIDLLEKNDKLKFDSANSIATFIWRNHPQIDAKSLDQK